MKTKGSKHRPDQLKLVYYNQLLEFFPKYRNQQNYYLLSTTKCILAENGSWFQTRA